MRFMEIVCRPDLARQAYKPCLCLWTQVDVWSTHLYLLTQEDNRYVVGVYSVRQEDKGRPAPVSTLVDALDEWPTHREEHWSLAEALQAIAGGSSLPFPEEDPHGLQAAYQRAVLREEWERMSKYQRKVFLREGGQRP